MRRHRRCCSWYCRCCLWRHRRCCSWHCHGRLHRCCCLWLRAHQRRHVWWSSYRLIQCMLHLPHSLTGGQLWSLLYPATLLLLLPLRLWLWDSFPLISTGRYRIVSAAAHVLGATCANFWQRSAFVAARTCQFHVSMKMSHLMLVLPVLTLRGCHLSSLS